MATYKIDSSLLTAQADEIRTLNGTTATMNPSQMTTALQSANAEVATQEQKIIEITEMLQGKAMGGSGSGGGVDTCTVTLRGYSAAYSPSSFAYTFMSDDGKIAGDHVACHPSSEPILLNNVVCNTVLTVIWSQLYNSTAGVSATNADLLAQYDLSTFHQITASAGGTVDLYNYSSIEEPPL